MNLHVITDFKFLSRWMSEHTALVGTYAYITKTGLLATFTNGDKHLVRIMKETEDYWNIHGSQFESVTYWDYGGVQVNSTLKNMIRSCLKP